MQINITGHHVEVTPALRAYVTEKMQKLERHFDHVLSAHVVLNVEKINHLAEATVNAAGKQLHATEQASDMYAAIDGLIDKLDRQVRRYKDRLRGNHHADPDAAQSAG